MRYTDRAVHLTTPSFLPILVLKIRVAAGTLLHYILCRCGPFVHLLQKLRRYRELERRRKALKAHLFLAKDEIA